MRIAYLVVPEHLVPAFVAGRSLIDGSAAKFNQVVLAEFMREGHFTAHTRWMRQIYQARRDQFVAAFARHLSGIATCNLPRAGLHITALLQNAYDEAETLAVAERSSWLPKQCEARPNPQMDPVVAWELRGRRNIASRRMSNRWSAAKFRIWCARSGLIAT
ncbi:hypothetical protein [Bosea sp. UC22_33]|uniref:hypothetical protein n=1 Tax=Bosea sp. UC22_33 TaxID=3350165 RepID=UPI00366C055C